MKRFKSANLILSMIGAFASINAGAVTNMFDRTPSNTTVINDSMVQIDGTLNDLFGQAEPWTMQVYGDAGGCLRIFIPTTDFDAKLTVIAPNGDVFRDDDSGGFLRPLVQISNAPNTGWYTVHVAHFAGNPTIANFTMSYGRFSIGNVNCAASTPPNAAISGVDISKAR